MTPGRLDPTFVVLRKVDVGAMSHRPNRNAPTMMERIGMGYAEQGVPESDLSWFRDGYVLNEQPRSSIVTDEVMKHTLGFAVARTDTGEILREYEGADGLAKAEAAVAGAQVNLAPALALPEDEGDSGDEAETES